MDYHEILERLTIIDKTENEEIKNFDGRLQQTLQKTMSFLTENDKKLITNENDSIEIDIRYQYLRAIVCALQNIKNSETTNESLFSVKQFRTLKIAIELIIGMGIIPALLPGVGINVNKLCPKASQISEEKIPELQKYERTKFVVLSLMELYNDTMFRPAILSHLGPLIAALLQLSHAPLMKPSKEASLTEQRDTNGEFKMTVDFYEKLRRDQEQFTCLLHKLLAQCPMSMSMKELMVILGIKGTPKWLQREARKYLVQRIVEPNGVISIIAAVCEDVLDLGEHWNKLDTISRLIATSHGNDADKYYEAICPQLLDLLESKDIKHSATIANCCIAALYEHNRDVCVKNIVETICEPLVLDSSSENYTTRSENEVEKCIENLFKCFVTVEAKFKHLPCELLMKVAVPLFCLYNNVRQTVCSFKSKIRQLVLRLLHEESFRINLFAAFLGHDLTTNFGHRLKSRCGPSGGIEILGSDETPKFEEFADSLLDLTSTVNKLSTELFSYLLKFLSNLMKLEKGDENLLESEDDALEKIEKQLAAVKLLSSLANLSAVQEAQTENSDAIFSFVKSLFNQYTEKQKSEQEVGDCEILYVSLMLVKMILSERKRPLKWSAFNDFVKFLRQNCSLSIIPTQLALLIKELIELIETQGRSDRVHYQDLSIDRKPSNKFDEALKDLGDPLLPVRAHGLITLTKLIENKDACATARKAVILQLFKENLKHEDSFIYLAAINGLCALAASFPQTVIETLVQEYIDMPQRISTGDLTAETRTKLGEILVKVTRALGEMASAYKDILINGFLCATRDPDSLVRASSLSCLGELCKVLGFRLGNAITEVIYCISCIIKTEKAPECRRAAVMVSTLLLRGLGKDTLTSLGKDLVELYRGLKYLRDNDEDPVLRLHAQLSLEELDQIVREFLFAPPALEKKIFLLTP